MDKLIVLIGAIILISFIVWWFFSKHGTSETEATSTNEGQEVSVIVDGGYSPNTVVLNQGVPAKIIFNRKDSSNCFSHVVFPDFGINQELPVNKLKAIDIDTSKPGEYQYACGMNMFFGKVVIK